jgi:VIT1/CCC1 family predicted Fe2+/Mn2+ transporter
MIATESNEIKSMIHNAVADALLANKDIIYDIFYEALEDFYMVQQIKEGESSGVASREEVFEILER